MTFLKFIAQCRLSQTKRRNDGDLAIQEWHILAIRKGLAEADAGKLLSHSEAVKRLRKWGKQGS